MTRSIFTPISSSVREAAPLRFLASQKEKAIERELGLRRRVYKNRVAEGRMSQKEADYQIAIFEAIRDDYSELAKKDRLL